MAKEPKGAVDLKNNQKNSRHGQQAPSVFENNRKKRSVIGNAIKRGPLSPLLFLPISRIS